MRLVWIGPQSNQRGIERLDRITTRTQNAIGLNRTSVGLKALGRKSGRGDMERPQSNQRGIESQMRSWCRVRMFWASIEPAWD